MNRFFSIIVPIYNVGEQLKKCIKSLLNQTFCDYEVILVDDGSTDGITPDICDAVVASDSRFQVLHCQNAGVAAARNRGLGVSSCEWFIFIDGDDTLYSEEILQQLHDLIECFPDVDIVKGGYQRVLTDGTKTVYHSDRNLFFDNMSEFLCANFKARCGGYSWNTVYRRSRILQYGLRMEYCSMEDHIFFLKYIAASKKALLSNMMIYNYYDNPESISYSPKFSAFDILEDALHERQLYQDIFSIDNAEQQNIINEGLSSNINRALFKLYHFEHSRSKRRDFVRKVKHIGGFKLSLKCLTFPMPFILRDILLNKKYGR